MSFVRIAAEAALTATPVRRLGLGLAAAVRLDDEQFARLATLAEPAGAYWSHRANLPWN